MRIRERGGVRSVDPPLTAAIEWLGRLPARRLTAVALTLVGAIGAADYFSGRDVAISIGYLLPVFVAAAAGGRSSTMIAAISTSTWTVLEFLTRPGPQLPPAVLVWNFAARFAVLWVVGALASHLANRLAEESDLSRTDPLTALPNARSFRETADDEIARMRVTGAPLTAAYVDLDGFKAMNDTCGHAAGDEVLATVGRVLRTALRPQDRVARLGGDEFAVLLPATDLDEALDRLRRLHDDLLAAGGTWSPQVGFSIGAVTFPEAPDTAAELLERADRVMYAAKRHCPNTVRGELARLSETV